jgi:DNA-damage-inducible protein J
MSKTILVSVDDRLKDSADSLFESLGLDTSTAVRMFLIAATKTGGIPFTISLSVAPDNSDQTIYESIAYREAGEAFLTIEQSLTNMQEAMKVSTGDV